MIIRYRTRALVAASLLVLACPPPSQAQTIDLDSGLEAYWTFDEGQGSWAGDLSGKLRGAGIYDAPAFAESVVQWTPEGRFGGAVAFDATYFLAAPDYFGVGGANPRTISLWINTTTLPTGANVIVAWGPNVAQQRWHFKLAEAAAVQGALRTENQGGNNYASVPVNDGTWHHIVSVFPAGGTVVGDVRHYVDGVLDDVQTGTTGNPVNTNIDPVAGRPVSIGGSPFDASFRYIEGVIDDVRVYSRALSPEEIAALAKGEGVVAGAPPVITLPDGVDRNPYLDPAAGLTFTAEPVGTATLAADRVRLEINGVNVTAEASITGGPASLTIKYSALTRDRDYQVVLTVTDSAGRANARRLTFNTYDPAHLTLEAEHYNFGGGQFFDAPGLCPPPGSSPNCYVDRLAQPGIDAHDSRGFTDDTTALDDVYRFSDGAPDRQEEFDTLASPDVRRPAYVAADLREYDVDRLDAGDWANYTHTFPATGNFRVLLRARAGAAQVVELSRITSNPAATDQEKAILGYFRVPAGSRHAFVPLTDLTGAKELAPALHGLQTLRLTALGAANNLLLNYVMFVPTEARVAAPSVSIQEPSAGSVHPTGGDLALEAAADDADGFVTRVTFFAESPAGRVPIGQATAAPFRVVWRAVPAGSYLVSAEAEDNDGLTALSAKVVITVDSEPPKVTSARGNTGLNAVELVFNEALDPVSGAVAGNYTLSPALAVTAAAVDGRRVRLTTAGQTASTEYVVTVRNVRDAHGNAITTETGSFLAGASGLSFGLAGYWTFDDGSGARARDLSGYGRDAAVYDVPAYAGKTIAWTPGRHGGAINFDGTYFLGTPGYFGIGGKNPRTIALWVKTDWAVSTGSNALMGWGRNATSARWHFKFETTGGGGALRTENQGGNNFGSIPVNDGAWHHIVSVFPEGGEVVGDVAHYVDGLLDEARNGTTGTVVDTSNDPLLAAPVTLGGAPLGLGGELRPIVALLDDVRLYDRALSTEEIQALARGEGILPGGGGPGPQPEIAITRGADGTLTLTWTGGGRLQRTPRLDAAWEDVPGATSPHPVPPEGTAFFRVVQP